MARYFKVIVPNTYKILPDMARLRPVTYKDKQIGMITNVTDEEITIWILDDYIKLYPEWNLDKGYLMSIECELGE